MADLPAPDEIKLVLLHTYADGRQQLMPVSLMLPGLLRLLPLEIMRVIALIVRGVNGTYIEGGRSDPRRVEEYYSSNLAPIRVCGFGPPEAYILAVIFGGFNCYSWAIQSIFARFSVALMRSASSLVLAYRPSR